MEKAICLLVSGVKVEKCFREQVCCDELVEISTVSLRKTGLFPPKN